MNVIFDTIISYFDILATFYATVMRQRNTMSEERQTVS